ncbi:hypothetical protein AAFF_G00110730 [Aldrovandia affinis]|uniref:Uncharacterized protein n=1 Tax=Aldrovandia affinis TaxID=143900 RepID=A0AAD7WBQ1_9TELE|nr:hypothetical protein AAFF_G00110730 [Aldrovandia affinis]
MTTGRRTRPTGALLVRKRGSYQGGQGGLCASRKCLGVHGQGDASGSRKAREISEAQVPAASVWALSASGWVPILAGKHQQHPSWSPVFHGLHSLTDRASGVHRGIEERGFLLVRELDTMSTYGYRSVQRPPRCLRCAFGDMYGEIGGFLQLSELEEAMTLPQHHPPWR